MFISTLVIVASHLIHHPSQITSYIFLLHGRKKHKLEELFNYFTCIYVLRHNLSLLYIYSIYMRSLSLRIIIIKGKMRIINFVELLN